VSAGRWRRVPGITPVTHETGKEKSTARPVSDPPDHVALDLQPCAVDVAEAVVERGVVRLAVDADDLDAADARFADLPEARVHDEEPAGRPLVDIAGQDRNRRDLKRPGHCDGAPPKPISLPSGSW